MAPADPHDALGWVVVAVGVVATIAAFALAAKYTFWPGETQAEHPKWLVLNADR